MRVVVGAGAAIVRFVIIGIGGERAPSRAAVMKTVIYMRGTKTPQHVVTARSRTATCICTAVRAGADAERPAIAENVEAQ